MAVRPRAPPRPPPAQLLRRLESRGAGAWQDHQGWEHFQIITIIFPQWRLQGEFICSAAEAECAGVAWSVWLPGQRAPARAPLTCSHWLQLGSIHVGTFSSLFRHTFPLSQQFRTGHQQLCESQNLQHEAKLPVIFSWRTCEMAGWRPGCLIQTPVNSNSNINFVHVLFGWKCSFWHKQSKSLIFHCNTVMSDYYYCQPRAKQNKIKQKTKVIFSSNAVTVVRFTLI